MKHDFFDMNHDFLILIMVLGIDLVRQLFL